jgi:protoporphyrinogen/coproporphyrinogen III oxidase
MSALSHHPAPGARPSIAVIGAGLSGLVTAYALRELGARVTVYEASQRTGGVVGSVVEDGYVGETGPHFVAGSPAVSALLDDLDLTSEVVDAQFASAAPFVVRRGRLVRTPATALGLLTSPLLSVPGRLRVLGELWAPGPWSQDESIAAFTRRRFGREVLASLVGPMVSCWTGGDPERLSVRHALPDVAAFEREHGSLVRGSIRVRGGRGTPLHAPTLLSFRDGMQTLTDALARALGPAVHVGAAVTGIARSGAGWIVTAGRASGTVRRATVDVLVYAGPAHGVRGISWPDSIRPLAGPLGDVHHAPVAVLTLGFRREHVAHPLNGLGVVVPDAEAYALAGALFVSSLFPGRAPIGHVAIACLVGGARRGALGAAPAETMRAAVIADLRRLVGVSGEPTFMHHATWTRGLPQYELGYENVGRAVSALEAAHPGLYFVGSYLGGIGIGDCIRSARALAHRVVAECALDQRLATPAGIVVGRIPMADRPTPRRPWPPSTSTSSQSPPTPTTSS